MHRVILYHDDEERREDDREEERDDHRGVERKLEGGQAQDADHDGH
jgi:hypothetical protein